MVKVLLFSCVLSGLVTAAEAATVTANSCSQADVQAAINSSSSGDTVVVPAGSCTWNSTVTVDSSHQVTLNGQGSATVTWGSSGGLSVTAGTSANTFITGFNFKGSFTNGNCPIHISTSTSPLTQAFRFFDNSLDGGNPGGPGTFICVNGNGPGLIDHNTFTCRNGADEMIHVLGTSGNSGWTDVVTPGGPNMIFIEDNTFSDSGGGGSSAVQSYYGARTVFRHNTLTSMQIDQHGTAGNVGARWWEVYNNNFNSGMGSCFRAGSGVVFSNTNMPWILMLEEDSGYPALYQVGQGQLQNGQPTSCSTGGAPGCQPAYAWSNGSAALNLNQTGCAPPQSNMVQLNRDVYSASTGTLSGRPSTCSPFQGYFATDQNTLYKCTATNVWTAYYTPYTYPHPLIQGIVLGPPTDLQATPQ